LNEEVKDKPEEEIPKTLLWQIDYVDKWLSKFVHDCVIRPKFMEYIVFPFAFLFSPYFIPVLIYSTGFVFPRANENH
jgi:hypothetical protein